MRMSSLYYYRQQQLIGHGRGGGLFALSSPLSVGRRAFRPVPLRPPSSLPLSLSLLPVVPPPPSAPVVSVGRGPPDVVSRMPAVGRVGRGAVPPSYRRRRRGDSTYTYTVLVGSVNRD